MKEQSIIEVGESRPGWEALKTFAREGIRRLLQQLLEEEVEDVLGRRWYERREGLDAPPGYRNGVGKPRRLSLMSRRRAGPRSFGTSRPVGCGPGGW
jgi:hypothetical protein